MRRLGLALLLLLSGCEQKPLVEDVERGTAAQRLVDAKKVSELQKIADAACHCSRGGTDSSSCWSDFWKQVSEYRHTITESACGPGSSAFVEFDREEGTQSSATMTVITAYGYGACSADEATTKKELYERQSADESC